jgi:hypothetical protein
MARHTKLPKTVRPDGTRQVFGMQDRGGWFESAEVVPEPHWSSTAETPTTRRIRLIPSEDTTRRGRSRTSFGAPCGTIDSGDATSAWPP